MNKILLIALGFFIVKDILILIFLLMGKIEEVGVPYMFLLSLLSVPIVIGILIIKKIIDIKKKIYIIDINNKNIAYRISEYKYAKYRKRIRKTIEKETKRKIYNLTFKNQMYNDFMNEHSGRKIVKLKNYKDYKNNVIIKKVIFEDEIED